MDPRKLISALHVPTMLLGLWFLFIQPNVSEAMPADKSQGLGILLVLGGLALEPVSILVNTIRPETITPTVRFCTDLAIVAALGAWVALTTW